MRLRNCLGMIWSVSTLVRSSGSGQRGECAKGLHQAFTSFTGDRWPVANVDEVAGDCGRGGHFRRDEVSASAASLAAFEVAVAGGGATLAGRKNVGIHAQAHGAAGLAPVESGFAEDAVEAFGFSACALTACEPGTTMALTCAARPCGRRRCGPRRADLQCGRWCRSR